MRSLLSVTLEKRVGVGVVAIAGALYLALSTSAAQDPAPEWVSFELIDQSALPIVTARLNRSERFRLVVDPAVPENLLDLTMVEGMGLELASQGEMMEIDYFGFKEKVPLSYVEIFEVGNIGRGGVPVLLIEGDDVTGAGGTRSYGRIGRAFLEPFRVTVYYPRRLLLLEPSPADEVPPGAVAFDPEHRFITVTAEVNGSVSGPFVIDPGASGTVIDGKWAEKHGLIDSDAKSVELASLVVGGFVGREVRSLVGDLGKLPYSGKPVGVLGASLLLRLAVTYDFPRGLVWLREVEAGG